MPGKKLENHDFLRGISKRRLQVLKKKDFSYFHVSEVPENLSEEEYARRLEDLKKLGNFC